MFNAISKSITKMFRSETVLSDYLRWRDVIFSMTDTQLGIDTGQPDQVYGVIMDVGLSDEFVITVTAFATGESSLRTTIGGGAIGLGNEEDIAEQAKIIVSLAQSLIIETTPISSHDLPKSDKVHFYFHTPAGLRWHETTVAEIDSQGHPWNEIFSRFSFIKARSEEITSSQNN